MRKESLELLERIMQAPSPSGFEQPVQRILAEAAQPYADETRVDVNGNLIVSRNLQGHPRIMLAGHCDQIGFMIQHIGDEGFLHFSAIGGIDAGVVPGERVIIHTSAGPVPGVIGRKPIHLQTPEERKGEKAELHKLWIDIGAASKDDAQQTVAVGDPITFPLGFQRLRGQIVAGAGFDDKVGAFVAMETLRLLARRKLQAAVFAVSTVQEELGLRGARTAAYCLDPGAAVAIDVTFATDHPQAEKTQIGDIRLGKGPVIARGPNINPPLHDLLVKAAESKSLPWQPEAISKATGTDANVIQISREGVAAAIVSIPCRYMHTAAETVSLDDIEQAAALLAEMIVRLTPEMDFIPR